MKIQEVKNSNIRRVEDSSVLREEKWSTYFDIQNRLVIHVGSALKTLYVDHNQIDPDGIPLVWVERQTITRVRQMTESEFEEAMNHYAKSIVINEHVELTKKEGKEEPDEEGYIRR